MSRTMTGVARMVLPGCFHTHSLSVTPFRTNPYRQQKSTLNNIAATWLHVIPVLLEKLMGNEIHFIKENLLFFAELKSNRTTYPAKHVHMADHMVPDNFSTATQAVWGMSRTFWDGVHLAFKKQYFASAVIW